MTILSVFGGGLWLIPLLLLVALVYCIYRVVIVRKGGTIHREKVNGIWREWYTSDQPKFTSIFSFWCAIILAIALITTIQAMIADK